MKLFKYGDEYINPDFIARLERDSYMWGNGEVEERGIIHMNDGKKFDIGCSPQEFVDEIRKFESWINNGEIDYPKLNGGYLIPMIDFSNLVYREWITKYSGVGYYQCEVDDTPEKVDLERIKYNQQFVIWYRK